MHELIANRWSARGYDVEDTISDDDLGIILDAGRWAPTWGRIQPVRFIVGRRGDATFGGLVDAFTRGNVGWAPRASALILVCTANVPMDEKAHTYAAVDCGLAVAQMSLQTASLGRNAHPIAGFIPEIVVERFGIPDDVRPLVILAVGRLADPTTLPDEIRERDEQPRSRLPLDEVAFAGRWGEPWEPAAD